MAGVTATEDAAGVAIVVVAVVVAVGVEAAAAGTKPATNQVILPFLN